MKISQTKKGVGSAPSHATGGQLLNAERFLAALPKVRGPACLKLDAPDLSAQFECGADLAELHLSKLARHDGLVPLDAGVAPGAVCGRQPEES